MRPGKLVLLAVWLSPVMFLAERRWPLGAERPPRQRLLANAVIGALAAVTTAVLEVPLARLATRHVERRRWALARLEPGLARTVAAVAWLDWTLYLWHRAAHRAPLLWRLHRPHHLDPALDTTTAWRFHLAELIAAVPLRLAQVLVAGVPSDALGVWRQLLFISITFHHSNVALPPRLERALGLVIMTPRLHRVHHGRPRELRDANWSSGLTLWDRLHGTLRVELRPERIGIGVDADAPAIRLGRALASIADPSPPRAP